MSSPSPQQRQQLQDELTRAVGTGRINIKQFDYLMGIVWSSESMADLDFIRRDYLGQGLPPQQVSRPTEPAPYRPAPYRPGQFSTQAPMKTTLGTISLTGRWTVPERQEFIASGGTIHIDLRQARADTPVVEFHINAKMSSVRIIAPPGVAVDNRMRNLASTVEMDNTIPHPNAPRVVLTGAISGCKLSVLRVPLQP
ncbi:hypothetical protein QP892_02605 [Corynebacterium pseudodiphtheriticum]|uniref:hypothetical protein n=1 Tax=Corynebacterium pseudodiphtheriticum TaxID=37637 RepID=UPI00255116D3|nr:hypothetical protein [Corynebacterium pseudodiphtheriticum]MDK8717408.1 hypothetical protein [Corynebacterium pseudodiphtheriticum]